MNNQQIYNVDLCALYSSVRTVGSADKLAPTGGSSVETGINYSIS